MNLTNIDKVKFIDIRIQTFDVPSDRIYTKEQKTVKLDYFVKWRVDDIYKFYLTTNADYRKSNSSFRGKINDGLRAEVGMRELKDVITGERGNIIAMLKTKAKEGAKNFGIEIIDVRIVKLDYPPEVTQSVYERMRVCVYECMCVCVYVRMCVCVCMCVCVVMCVLYTYTCICVRACTSVCICAFVCQCA